MASSGAVIGALRVVLGADSAALETGLKNASKSLDEFAAKASQAGRLAAAGLTLAIAGLSVAIKGTINEADKLYKMSQSFGVPIEELSKLKYAADLSGVSLEALGKSVSKLSRNMAEAAANPTGEAAKAFDALRIKVQNADGTLKSSSQMIEEIAGKFAGFKDGAAKTALAIQLFGSAGADMIPMLNMGKQGLQDMKSEAEQLGLVIDKRTGAAAEAFNDNLTRLKKVKDGIIIQITARLLPALLGFSEKLVSAAKDSETMRLATSTLMTALQGVGTVAAVLGGVISAALQQIGGIIKALMFLVKGEFGKAFDAFLEGNVDMVKTVAGTVQLVTSMWTGMVTAAQGAGKGIKKALNDAPILQGNQNAIDKYISSLVKKGAALQADLQTIGMSESAHMRLKAVLELEAIAKENNLKITEAQRQKLLETVNANAVLIDSLERSREQWENFRGVVLNVRSSLENAFVDAIMQAKSFRDVVRSLISDLARMAAQSAFRSLFGGQLDWTQMAGRLFGATGGATGGFAGIPAFANGGSIMPGGGPSGIDTQLVQFWKSPSERVDIYKPGQDNGVSAGAPQTLRVVVESNDEKFRVFVRDEAGNVVAGGIQSYDRSLPDRVSQIQQNPRRR